VTKVAVIVVHGIVGVATLHDHTALLTHESLEDILVSFTQYGVTLGVSDENLGVELD
jgi:hypothetical protein